jgi:hypothetical protein
MRVVLLVTDEEIESAFQNTNFGRTDYRELLSASVLKKLVGYRCGHTITVIMQKLGLIGKTEKVTRKGIELVRESFRDVISLSG